MIYLISLICFAPFLYMVRFSAFGVPTTLLEILIYAAAIITIVIKIRNKSKVQNSKLKIKSIIHNSPFIIPIILFVLSGIISVAIAPDKREALGLFKAYIFDPILFFFVLIYNLKDGKDLKIIFRSLVLSGVFVSVFAIYQKITGNVTVDNRVLGIFLYEPNASPNFLAMYLAPLAVIAFGQSSLMAKNTLQIVLYDLIFFIIILALYFSGSRAGAAAGALGMTSFIIIRNWSWIRARLPAKIFLSLAIVLALVGIWSLAKPDFSLTESQGSRVSTSNNIRFEIWSTTVKDIIPAKLNWLAGVGLGNYQNYFTSLTAQRVNYPEYISPWALTPHNIFLTIWVNLGLLGIVAFVWLLVAFFKHCKLNPYCLILTAVMITILAEGLFDSTYWKNDLALIFWIILASGFATNQGVNNENRN